jgi:pyruvate-formate lyase
MNFEEFQSQSRLYVIAGLEFEQVEEFERARNEFGQKAEDFIRECYTLHEAFALSLRPAKATAAIKERLMSMVRERKQGTHTRDAKGVPLMTAATKQR